MTVLLLLWVTGCRGEQTAPPSGAPAVAETAHTVEIVLDRGRQVPEADGGGWVSVPAPEDVLVAPPAVGGDPDATGARRWRAVLPPGPGVATVGRAGCGPVAVPYTVGLDEIVVLPYPTCTEPDASEVPDAPGVVSGALLDRREAPWAAIALLHGLALFPEVPEAPPGQEDGPARYVTLDEARAICAWSGGRLPTRAEWAAARSGATGTPITNDTRALLGSTPSGDAARGLAGLAPHVGPAGHQDLDGNVEEWLADGTVAGGSYVSLPEELGVTRDVPANARSESIGFRCAWDPR
ncbi:MAG: SUMF1/EgtB/PvdO family nonheme iron enzyme [Pseudomonadota bacterium]|nr:SUMF1/EgtB/PvdO family nonheme iron enzyme [Pseudomonadota bacterium]